MFETQQFEDDLDKVISRTAGNQGLTKYQNSAVRFLRDLAISNESDLMIHEVKKAAGLRRGVREALKSAELLTREASRYARDDNRDTLTQADMQKAYQANFCQVWPFCK